MPKVKVTLNLDKETHEAAMKILKSKGINMSFYVNNSLIECIDTERRKSN